MTENEKRPVGRPKKVDSKTCMLSVRLTSEEDGEISKAATRAGLKKSEWIQKTLLNEARRINCMT